MNPKGLVGSRGPLAGPATGSNGSDKDGAASMGLRKYLKASRESSPVEAEAKSKGAGKAKGADKSPLAAQAVKKPLSSSAFKRGGAVHGMAHGGNAGKKVNQVTRLPNQNNMSPQKYADELRKFNKDLRQDAKQASAATAKANDKAKAANQTAKKAASTTTKPAVNKPEPEKPVAASVPKADKQAARVEERQAATAERKSANAADAGNKLGLGSALAAKKQAAKAKYGDDWRTAKPNLAGKIRAARVDAGTAKPASARPQSRPASSSTNAKPIATTTKPAVNKPAVPTSTVGSTAANIDQRRGKSGLKLNTGGRAGYAIGGVLPGGNPGIVQPAPIAQPPVASPPAAPMRQPMNAGMAAQPALKRGGPAKCK